jgi:hypothetical protein
MVGYADSIAVGKVVPVGSGLGVHVREMLKGPRPSDVVQIEPHPRSVERLPGGGEVVLFIAEQAREGLFSPGDWGGLVIISDRVAVYDLTRRHENTYDIRMRRLHDPADVLTAVRAAVKFEAENRGTSVVARPGAWNWVSLPLPGEFASEAMELLLPLDQRTEAAADEWERSDNPQWRIMAVRAARAMDTKRSRATIARLLEDPAYTIEPSQGWDSRVDWRRRRIYFVRQAAWESTTGRPAGARAILEGPDTGWYARPSVRSRAAVAAGAIILLASSIWLGRRRRSWGTGLAVMCVGLGLITAWAWWRSYRTMTAFSFNSGNSEHELVSQHGGLAWLRVRDDPPPRGLLMRTEQLDRQTPRNGFWFTPHLAADVLKRSAGVTLASGKTASPGYGVVAYPFYLLEMRYSLLVAALGAWPVLFGTTLAARQMRRRIRRATGRCASCGYDIRSINGACPECGAARG